MVTDFLHPLCNRVKRLDVATFLDYLDRVGQNSSIYVRWETFVVCKGPPCTCQSPGGLCTSKVAIRFHLSYTPLYDWRNDYPQRVVLQRPASGS